VLAQRVLKLPLQFHVAPTGILHGGKPYLGSGSEGGKLCLGSGSEAERLLSFMIFIVTAVIYLVLYHLPLFISHTNNAHACA